MRTYWYDWTITQLVDWLNANAHLSLDMVKATFRTKAVPPEKVRIAIQRYWSNE